MTCQNKAGLNGKLPCEFPKRYCKKCKVEHGPNELCDNPIQKKRRLIIDRIQFLKSLKWNDFIKQWVNDLHDELEEIDERISN